MYIALVVPAVVICCQNPFGNTLNRHPAAAERLLCVVKGHAEISMPHRALPVADFQIKLVGQCRPRPAEAMPRNPITADPLTGGLQVSPRQIAVAQCATSLAVKHQIVIGLER
ncbi:MAG: hypothetical protein U0R19_15670 [Bryobacteraceae bacterium]